MVASEMEPVELHTSSQQVQLALEQLLQRHGVQGSQDAVVVKESSTRTGRKLYIITALNGAEQVVKNELAPVSEPRAYCGAGTWVLRQKEIYELVRRAATF